ncbi:peptidylprolyl isomerase [Roseivirga sp. E12]|uniref:peptidylprolyl isomerase n=1 Tax=Roseivirga sp. E12 TaxID=2819237 RepID=UPI001ABCD764|nr:peptidylprolyl isomerase [Roseivirga sp. E12]MBO3699716.1 peptidylprolyl isomerase [Roseivirga sp. E12]
MKGVCTLLIGLLCSSTVLAYQSEQIIVAQINDYEVSSSELLYGYQKNRDDQGKLHIDSLKKYLENYINFKLKVQAAVKQGYDTTAGFKQELAGYLSQIRKPYLDNPEAEEKLISEIHRRKQIEIDASHLLIKVAPNASPSDTLRAYQLVDSLRQTVKSKEEFEALAKRFSQDGSAQNGGKLGWFSAMDMVGPFENAAYHTEENQVSEVVKTQFGYHILYINQVRPSRGSLKSSHIFFSTQGRSRDATQRIAEAIYDSLKNGADWNTMTRRYSNDNRTKMNGGQLPWARIKQLPDEFYDIAYGVKEINGISKPQRTQFGWHIVKLDDERPIGPLSEERSAIEQQLKRSGRNVLNNDQLINKLKTENNFQQNKTQLNAQLSALSEGSLNEIIKRETIFRIGQRQFQLSDFIKTLPSQKIVLNNNIIRSLYLEFERKSIIAYEDSIAPIKYPEYGFLRQEYKEGLLLFEIMQKEVWNKAIEDSVGSKVYYENHLDQYKAEKRLEVTIISSEEVSLVERLMKSEVKAQSIEELAKSIFTNKEQSLLKIVKRTIKASEMNKFDPTELKSGSWAKDSDTPEYYYLNKIIPSGYFSYEEIKGQVLSGYQDFLEQQWIRQLRAQNSIKIYDSALKEIVKN